VTLTLPVMVLGVVTGLGIGALAMGLVLIHRASRVVNLAQAQIGALSATVAAALVRDAGIPFALGALAAVLAGAGLGGAVDATIIRRLRPLPRSVSLIATLGVTQLLVAGGVELVDHIANRSGGYPLPFDATLHLGEVTLRGPDLMLLVVVPLLAAVLAVWLRISAVGTAVRAASDNPDAARCAGIPVERLSTVVWAVAGASSALVALALLAGRPLVGSDAVGPETLFLALGAASLAGLASLPVSLGAGVLLGVVQQVVLYNWPNGGAADAVVFCVVVGALLLRRRAGLGEAPEAWARAATGSRWHLPRARGPAWVRLAAIVALFVAAAGASLLETNAHTLELAQIVAYALLAVSTTVVVGTAGHVSLGQVGFFGLGAAVSYQLSASVAVPFWLALLGAVVVGGVASVVVALPALHGSGVLFAVTTLGFALVAQRWLLAQSWLIGPGALAPRPVIGPFDLAAQRAYYVFALILLAGGIWLARNLLRSGPGRAMVASRDNEAGAAAFAVRVTRTKVLGFAVAGSLAALAGAVYAHGVQNFSVSDFPVTSPGLQAGAVDSLRIVAIVVIGGLGSITGAVVAAIIVVGIDQVTGNVVIQLLVSSLGVLVLLALLPGGLASVPPVLRRLVWRPARREVPG